MFRKILILILALIGVSSGCLSAISSGAEGIGDPYYPQLGNGGYDVLRYTLELTVDPQPNFLSGMCSIQARATQPLKVFNLDFSGLTIERITVNDLPGEYERNEQELTISSSQLINEGDIFTVTVSYSGSPETSRSLGGWFQAGWFHNKDNEIYVSSEFSGASTWYPVNDHPLDKASYSFRITVPKPYVVAANGLLQQEVDNGDLVTYYWEASEPMASYLTALNIAEYVIETEQGPDGILIRNYYPPDFPDASKEGFNQTAEMLVFFSDRFGPYPFAAYGSVIVDIPEFSFGAMETQTLSQHGLRHNAIAETIVAHELAHSWFGNSVSLESWQDIWLKEGAATYAEWIWTEHKKGVEALEATIRGVYETETRAERAPGNPPESNLVIDTVYDRGALTFHALRLRVGDDVFFQILRTYTDRFRYSNASTADFITIAEEISNQDLGDFFDAWLYTAEIPTIPEMGLMP